jgi:hypothetical protein
VIFLSRYCVVGTASAINRSAQRARIGAAARFFALAPVNAAMCSANPGSGVRRLRLRVGCLIVFCFLSCWLGLCCAVSAVAWLPDKARVSVSAGAFGDSAKLPYAVPKFFGGECWRGHNVTRDASASEISPLRRSEST